MDTEFDHEFSGREFSGDQQIVYVRPVEASELPTEIQSQLGGLKHLYAVHNADGERLALVRNRRLAFALARQHDMTPLTIH